MTQFKCHCIIHLYNGVITTVKKEMIDIEADNEESARQKVGTMLRNRYRSSTTHSLSSVSITIYE